MRDREKEQLISQAKPMSRIKVGQQIPSKYSLKTAYIILFVSRFCSRCIYSKKILNEALNHRDVKIPFIEIDVAYSHPLVDLFLPQIVPTVVLVDQENQVRAVVSSQITPSLANALTLLILDMTEKE